MLPARRTTGQRRDARRSLVEPLGAARGESGGERSGNPLMCSDVRKDKMLSMLHDDDLPVAPAHAHPHHSAVTFPSPRPDGARREHNPHTLTSRGGAVDVEG